VVSCTLGLHHHRNSHHSQESSPVKQALRVESATTLGKAEAESLILIASERRLLKGCSEGVSQASCAQAIVIARGSLKVTESSAQTEKEYL